MGKDTEIIVLEDCKPIKANKIKYYEDEYFMQRLMKKVKTEILEHLQENLLCTEKIKELDSSINNIINKKI